jgi:hypothetical protein
MATIKRFEDIGAWQKARELSKEIYAITKIGEFSKDYELKGQKYKKQSDSKPETLNSKLETSE